MPEALGPAAASTTVNANQCKWVIKIGNSRLTLHYPNLKLLEFAWCWRIPGHHCHQMILASCIRRPSRLKLCPWSAGHLADHRLGPCLHIVSPLDNPQSPMRKLCYLCRLRQDVYKCCVPMGCSEHTSLSLHLTFCLWPCHVWRWEVPKAQRSSGRAVVYLSPPRPRNSCKPKRISFRYKGLDQSFVQYHRCQDQAPGPAPSCLLRVSVFEQRMGMRKDPVLSRESKNTSL